MSLIYMGNQNSRSLVLTRVRGKDSVSRSRVNSVECVKGLIIYDNIQIFLRLQFYQGINEILIIFFSYFYLFI